MPMTSRLNMTDNDNHLSGPEEHADWVGAPGPGTRLQDDDILLLGNPVADPCLRHVSEIICLDAIGGGNRNLTRVSFAERSALVRKSLRVCAARLNPKAFLQADRSCIVNLAHIRNMKLTDRNVLLLLSNNREVLVTRRQSLRLRKAWAL
jgi:LytTr DNA-binding domain